MDITTILGLFCGFLGVFGAIFWEGGFQFGAFRPFFTNYSAFFVILVGTSGCTILASKMKDLKRTATAFKEVFQAEEVSDMMGIIETIVSLAEKARREGLLALEGEIPEIKNQVLVKGLHLVIDGTDPELVEAILQTCVLQKKNQANEDATLFETLGGFAPTMGIVGTVMGLVGALGKMNTAGQAKTIDALSVAFIATFWGIGLANLVFLPIGNKIRSRWRDALVMYMVIVEGVSSIQQGNNPRIVRERLTSFITLEEGATAGGEAEAKK